jgi:hypothetical protein
VIVHVVIICCLCGTCEREGEGETKVLWPGPACSGHVWILYSIVSPTELSANASATAMQILSLGSDVALNVV